MLFELKSQVRLTTAQEGQIFEAQKMKISLKNASGGGPQILLLLHAQKTS